MLTANIGKPQPNAEYGMNSISFDTLNDPLKIGKYIFRLTNKIICMLPVPKNTVVIETVHRQPRK